MYRVKGGSTDTQQESRDKSSLATAAQVHDHLHMSAPTTNEVEVEEQKGE